MAADMQQVATYIVENGIDNFRSKEVKVKNRDIFNYINGIGGFAKFKNNYINGVYDTYFEAIAEKTKMTGILPIVEVREVEVYVEAPPRLDDSLDIPFSEEMPQYEMFESSEVMNVLDKMMNTQELLLSKIMELEEANKSNTVSAEQEMRNKISILENDMIENIRESIVGMIQKYSYVKYGSRKGEAIRRGYRDMYDLLDSKYDVNIESIQLAYIKRTNAARIANGKQPIEFVDANVKGIRKIDIIERMGMLTEFYILVKSRLESVIPD